MNSNMNNYIEPRILCKKLCLIGNYNVGKTSLVHRQINNKFDDKVVSTIGASFYSDYYISDDLKIKLEIWDTAGNERYEALAPMYFRNSDIILLVYDLTDSESIIHIRKWLRLINRTIDLNDIKAEIIIVGNKLDLLKELYKKNPDYNKKYIDELNNYINETKYLKYEISCKTGENISNLFNRVKDVIIAQHKLYKSNYIIDTDKIILDINKNNIDINKLNNADKCC